MQNAETVLGVIRERGRRGLPLERLYRQLFNPQLFLRAYGRIYANKGAMTPGLDFSPGWRACLRSYSLVVLIIVYRCWAGRGPTVASGAPGSTARSGSFLDRRDGGVRVRSVRPAP
jgi:hypothetical protein